MKIIVKIFNDKILSWLKFIKLIVNLFQLTLMIEFWKKEKVWF